MATISELEDFLTQCEMNRYCSSLSLKIAVIKRRV